MAYNKHLREIVENLLWEDKKCREDTKWLTYRVFQEVALNNGEHIYLPFKLMDKFPSFESVARCKRDIMNKENKFAKDFVPDPNIEYIPKEKQKSVIANEITP
ncbi:MAG: hypothetical protein ACFFG0_07920 [Candidatus Thorarchaeota archaeon]